MKSRRVRITLGGGRAKTCRRLRAGGRRRQLTADRQFIRCPWSSLRSVGEAAGVPESLASSEPAGGEAVGPPVEWLDCPECGLPASVLERFHVRSTDGPIPHAVTVCAQRHRICAAEESSPTL